MISNVYTQAFGQREPKGPLKVKFLWYEKSRDIAIFS